MGIRFPHLFEFMELPWLPTSIRNTMREILECGNGLPFRPHYDSVASLVADASKTYDCSNIVELGAGTAPLTRRLAKSVDGQIKLIPCDIMPDKTTFQELESSYPDIIHPVYEPVDLAQPRSWPNDTMLVLCATLHQLPYESREQATKALASSADTVLVIEPLRKTVLSALFVIFSSVPAFILPIRFINRPERLRRFFWCWVVPVAPLAFIWDGWVACMRQWSDAEFRQRISKIPDVEFDVRHGVFTQVVRITSQDSENSPIDPPSS